MVPSSHMDSKVQLMQTVPSAERLVCVASTEEQIGAWADLPDGEVITEGTKVTHNGKKWVCVAQHFKSSVYSPRVNSTKWEEIT